VRLIAVRLLASFFALTWLLLPGFGLIDLSVTWDPEWPVVLEASWGVYMTVLIGGSFLAFAVRPTRAAPATVTLLVALATLVVAAVAGREWPALGYAGLLAVETAVLAGSLPDREPAWPLHPSVRLPLLVVALAGTVPWLLHAGRMFEANRRDAGQAIGELTMGVDHHAVQGALALAIVVLSLLAAWWPRGRRFLGSSVGLCAGYVGLVSLAFPGAWAGFDRTWSWLCMAWGAAVLTLAAPRLQSRELRGQVVETQ
jgi:hypothetical protein